MAALKHDKEEIEVTRAEAARILGASRSHVQRLTERGILKSRQDDSEVHWYKVNHLEAIKDRLNIGEDDQRAVYLEAQNELTKMALEHAKATFKPVHDATNAALNVLKDENSSLRARCRKLEETHIDLIITLETLLSEKHARDMLTVETTARIERNKNIVDTLKEAVGPLAEQVKQTIAMRNPMMRFLHTVDKEKLKALLFSGLLSDEETAALREMLESAGMTFPQTVETDSVPIDDVLEPKEES